MAPFSWSHFQSFFLLGAGGLEPPNSEEGGFTVPCNCRYATPPNVGKRMLAKGIEPSTVRLQVGRSTIELRQRRMESTLANLFFLVNILFFNRCWRHRFLGSFCQSCLEKRSHVDCFFYLQRARGVDLSSHKTAAKHLGFTTFFKFLA